MFGARKSKQIAREGASEWADEALALFGYNAEAEIREQMELHPYPARYAFQYCLAEIEKRRRMAGMPPPSLTGRLASAARSILPRRRAAVDAEPIRIVSPVNTCKLLADAS